MHPIYLCIYCIKQVPGSQAGILETDEWGRWAARISYPICQPIAASHCLPKCLRGVRCVQGASQSLFHGMSH